MAKRWARWPCTPTGAFVTGVKRWSPCSSCRNMWFTGRNLKVTGHRRLGNTVYVEHRASSESAGGWIPVSDANTWGVQVPGVQWQWVCALPMHIILNSSSLDYLFYWTQCKFFLVAILRCIGIMARKKLYFIWIVSCLYVIFCNHTPIALLTLISLPLNPHFFPTSPLSTFMALLSFLFVWYRSHAEKILKKVVLSSSWLSLQMCVHRLTVLTMH